MKISLAKEEIKKKKRKLVLILGWVNSLELLTIWLLKPSDTTS